MPRLCGAAQVETSMTWPISRFKTIFESDACCELCGVYSVTVFVVGQIGLLSFYSSLRRFGGVVQTHVFVSQDIFNRMSQARLGASSHVQLVRKKNVQLPHSDWSLHILIYSTEQYKVASTLSANAHKPSFTTKTDAPSQSMQVCAMHCNGSWHSRNASVFTFLYLVSCHTESTFSSLPARHVEIFALQTRRIDKSLGRD